MTSIELLKAYGLQNISSIPTPDVLLSDWAVSKQYPIEVIRNNSKSNLMGKLLMNYFLGGEGGETDESRCVLNYFTRNLKYSYSKTSTYVGSREQNSQIDRACSQSRIQRVSTFGAGTSSRFVYSPGIANLLTPSIKKVPIAVIGKGAAGILVKYALMGQGFQFVRTFEKSNDLGIWSRAGVYSRSRNNPLKLSFTDRVLEKAPGSGEEVREFLSLINAYNTDHIQEIKSCIPGVNFNHSLYTNETTVDYPIVIHCGGLGTPRPANDPVRMRTRTNATGCGERWQRILERKEVSGKHFTFIGLGNSTAEMLRQLHTFQDEGIVCDYTILTHYPLDSVQNPDSTVTFGKKNYRVFRELSIPNLTSYQGDLTDSRYDYFRALRAKKIISNVLEWDRTSVGISYRTNGKGFSKKEYFLTDKLFTLIGYQPTKKVFDTFGIPTDPIDECSMLDYDGEVQCVNRASRMFKGYFVFGAMAVNPLNKNSIVIPGMLFRLHDLIPSVIMRAAEYVFTQENG